MDCNKKEKAGRRKAQAAVEYLTTYGWAVLVIAVVLAALLWLGIFNATGRIPDRCDFQPGIKCDSIKFVSAGSEGEVSIAHLKITNQLPERIAVCGLSCTTLPDDTPPALSASLCLGATHRKVYIEPGESAYYIDDSVIGYYCQNQPFTGGGGGIDINLPPKGVANIGETLKATLFIRYVRESDVGGASRVLKGEAVATVQPDAAVGAN